MFQDHLDKLKEKIVIIKDPHGGQGTGIVLNEYGLILTNHHVVQKQKTVMIKTLDGKKTYGKVVFSKPCKDIAFVLSDLTMPAPFPEFSLRVVLTGEEVMAIGHPLGYDYTVTKGIISCPLREVEGVGYLQTDVPINPGNSGGPIVDSNGFILGMNTWIISNAHGLSFALPSQILTDHLEQLPDLETIKQSDYCVSCGQVLNEKNKYCPHCGEENIESGKANYNEKGICSHCSHINDENQRYCEKCGCVLDQKISAIEKEKAEVSLNTEVVCKTCGKNNKNRKYCEKCGASFE